MSRISLSGNPSGTGTFTIASPNSNADRTLDLPDQAGMVATSGISGVNSVPVGRGAGNQSTNTAVGASALAANTTGVGVVAVGRLAASANTTGLYTTAVGEAALRDNTTGNFNTAVGNSALVFSTTGGSNVALGQEALRSNTTASNNTAVGYQAGFSNTTATNNAFLGDTAGYFTTGARSTFVGSGAGSQITTGSANTILGRFNGNQGFADIRTSSNNIVLSDGDGNPHLRSRQVIGDVTSYEYRIQTNHAFGALYDAGNLNPGASVGINVNAAGGDGSVGLIAVATRWSSVDGGDSTFLQTHSHGNTYNTYPASLLYTTVNSITISNAGGMITISNGSANALKFEVRYINLTTGDITRVNA
jgi:hypothetical protein